MRSNNNNNTIPASSRALLSTVMVVLMLFQVASALSDRLDADDGLVVVSATVVHLSAVQAPGSSREAGLVGRRLGESLAQTYSGSLFPDPQTGVPPLYFNNRQIQTLSAQSPMALRAASGILEGLYDSLPSPTSYSSSSSSSHQLSAPLPYFPPPMRAHNNSILPIALGNVLLERDTLLLPNGAAPGRRAWLESVVAEGGVSLSSVLPNFEANFMNSYVLTGQFDSDGCWGSVCCKAIVEQASALMDASKMLASSSSTQSSTTTSCPTCLNTTILAEMARDVNLTIPYSAVTSASWGCMTTSDGSMIRWRASFGCAMALYADLQARETSHRYVPPTMKAFASALQNTQFVMNQLIYSVLPSVLQNVAGDETSECDLPASPTTATAPIGFELGLAIAQLSSSFNPSSSPKVNLFTLEADSALLLGKDMRGAWPAGWPNFTTSPTTPAPTPLSSFVASSLLPSSEAALITLLLSTGINITTDTNSPFALTPGTTIVFEVVNDTTIVDSASSLFVRARVGTPSSGAMTTGNYTFMSVNLPCTGGDSRCTPNAWVNYLYSTLPSDQQSVPTTPAEAALALRHRLCQLPSTAQKLLNCSNTDAVPTDSTTACVVYRQSCPDLACCQTFSPTGKCQFGLNAQSLNCGAFSNIQTSPLLHTTAPQPSLSSRRLQRLQSSLTSNSSVEDLIDSMAERARVASLDKKSWRYVQVSVVCANVVVGLPLVSMILMWFWGWHLTTNVAHLEPQEEEEERQKLLSSIDDTSRPKQSSNTEDTTTVIGGGGYSLYSPVEREGVNGSPADSDQGSNTSGGKRRVAPTLQRDDPKSAPHAYGSSRLDEREQLLGDHDDHNEEDSMIMKTPERLTTPPPSPGNVIAPPTSATM